MAGLKIDQSINQSINKSFYLSLYLFNKKVGESKRTPKHDWLHLVIYIALSTCGSPKSGKPI